ncbi:hypothetical protein FHW67_004253 [Herbaspirillum sp. Sphag1AN]|nr:hypothetical protein [Herbaspirillum sp. Sphag1AN]MBB3248121.1 hypothetical protein [Herbaspirillum sp. Sphag64]
MGWSRIPPINLARLNWSGIGNTNDEITGEETLRQRMFNFCLFQHDGPQVLCLYNVPVMNLNYPEDSALEKIIAVLKSIEFVDMPTDVSPHLSSIRN